MQRHAELVGQPVIIAQVNGSSQVVLDSSPQAKGVVTGMSLQEALSRAKDATLLEADDSYYETTFDDLIHALSQCSDRVENADLGCAYVGLDGLESMYGGEARLITTLLDAVPGEFNPRVGVADGKFPAYVAAVSSLGGQATRVPADVAGFLRDCSVDLLPLSWEDRVRFHEFRLHTLGQVADTNIGPMQAQFGPPGKRAWELATGIDNRSLTPDKPEETISEYLTFPSP